MAVAADIAPDKSDVIPWKIPLASVVITNVDGVGNDILNVVNVAVVVGSIWIEPVTRIVLPFLLQRQTDEVDAATLATDVNFGVYLAPSVNHFFGWFEVAATVDRLAIETIIPSSGDHDTFSHLDADGKVLTVQVIPSGDVAATVVLNETI